MRIAFLTHSYPATSKERQYAANYIFSFAQILANKVEKVFVFAPDYGGRKEKYQKVPVFWIPLRGDKKRFGYLKPWNPKDIIQFFTFFEEGSRLVVSEIRKQKIDFCFVFWVFPSGVFAILAKKKLGVPYVVQALGSDVYFYPRYPLLKQLIVYLLKEATVCFGHGEYMCEKVKALSGKPCNFFPCLSTLSFKNIQKIDLDPKRFNFLYLGRLEKIKGIELLIDAFANLGNERKYNLYIIGDGTLKKELQEKVNRVGLEKNIRFLGKIEDEKLLAGYYLAADAVVIPSRVECFPLVFTEAMRAQIPIIAANIGDMGRLIKKYHLGYTFNKENRESFQAALLKALKEGKNFKKKRRLYLKKIGQQYSLEAVVDDFVKKFPILNLEERK